MLPISYALLGSPVSGSKSPDIHNTSFAYNHIRATYEALEVEPENLQEILNNLVEKGYKGFNITIPHKESVIKFLSELDPLAQKMGAVNTVVVTESGLKGYNTDGPGLVMALEAAGLQIKGLSVLLVGAGGAAKGIAHSLAIYGASKIHVYNRTTQRARLLLEDLSDYADLERAVFEPQNEPSESVVCHDYDLVINTTSVGMSPEVDAFAIDPKQFTPETAFCDIVYKPHETRFLQEAKNMGAKCIYGIDMLMMQALLSEVLWTGKAIDLPKTLEVVRSHLFKDL